MDSGGPDVVLVVVLVVILVGGGVIIGGVAVAFGTTAPCTEDEFERFADQCILCFAVQLRGWQTRHASDWWMEDCCCYSHESCNEISFSFIKFKFKFDVLSLLSTSLVDAFVLMGGKFKKFSSPKLSEIYIQYVFLSLSSLSLDDLKFAFRTWSTRTMHTLGLWSRTASLKTTVHCWVEIFCTILCENNNNFSGTFCKNFSLLFYNLVR